MRKVVVVPIMSNPSFITVVMRRLAARVVVCVMACVVVAPSAGAQGPRGGRGGMSHGGSADARGARQAERAQQRAARANPPRETPQRTVEPPMQTGAPSGPPEAAPGGRQGRLTPDERRALRQQINEAGRDVYRPNRP